MLAQNRFRPTRGSAVRSLAPRLAMTAAALSLLTACSEESSVVDPSPEPFQSGSLRNGTFYGAAVKLGDGTARSYFTTEDGVTTEVGFALSEKALQGLPAGNGHSDGSHAHFNSFDLRMHPQNTTPFRFLELNWNPQGHEPEGVYTVPHFDFHFWMRPAEERNAIDPSDPQWAQNAANVPAPEYLPAGYVPGGPPGTPLGQLAVPRMGVHWVDMASPELNGSPFTETFIYGTWNGKVMFVEPMITKAMLESKPSFSRALPTPQKGYAPGSYRIYWNPRAREYRVALTGLPTQP